MLVVVVLVAVVSSQRSHVRPHAQTSVLRDLGAAPFARAAVLASAERADLPARLPRRMKVGLGLRSTSAAAAAAVAAEDGGDTDTASIPWNLAQKFNLAEAKEQFLYVAAAAAAPLPHSFIAVGCLATVR